VSADAPSPVLALRVACSILPGGGARLAFTLEGRIAALRVPATSEPNPWPLWQHTCFEAFVTLPGQTRYREFNFSPAGLWVASAFKRYREIEPEWAPPITSPVLETGQRADALWLAADLPPDLLPSAPMEPVLQIGLAAVVERIDGRLEYWALTHPLAERPDFHHPDGWTLRLDTREVSP
jgi:hypothetical protein